MAISAVNFVRLIEEYPCLYNNKIPEYSRKDVTDTAWREVARKTKTSVSVCQAKWKNIRNGFVRSLKPTPSGSSTKQRKMYYLYKEMQFVLPFVKAMIHTDEPMNIPTPPQAATEDNELNSSTNEEGAQSSANVCSESVSKTLNKPKIRKVTNEADKAFVEWIKWKGSQSENPRKMFLLSLLPDVECLSEEQMRKFRIQVLLLLEEIQTGESQQYSANYSPTKF